MSEQRDLGLTFAGGGSRAFYQLGLLERWGDQVLSKCGIHYDGTEGELYRVDEDPHQWRNLWDDPAHAAAKADLLDDLRASFAPLPRRQLAVEAPA